MYSTRSETIGALDAIDQRLLFVPEEAPAQPWEPEVTTALVQRIRGGDEFAHRLVVTALTIPPGDRMQLVGDLETGEPTVLADLKRLLRVNELAAVKTLDDTRRQKLTGGLYLADTLTEGPANDAHAVFRLSDKSLRKVISGVSTDYREIVTARQNNGH